MHFKQQQDFLLELLSESDEIFNIEDLVDKIPLTIWNRRAAMVKLDQDSKQLANRASSLPLFSMPSFASASRPFCLTMVLYCQVREQPWQLSPKRSYIKTYLQTTKARLTTTDAKNFQKSAQNSQFRLGFQELGYLIASFPGCWLSNSHFGVTACAMQKVGS